MSIDDVGPGVDWPLGLRSKWSERPGARLLGRSGESVNDVGKLPTAVQKLILPITIVPLSLTPVQKTQKMQCSVIL